MDGVIVLDDDDDVLAAGASSVERTQPAPSGGGLSQEQRARMAQQKELALARRQAKEKHRQSISGRQSIPTEPRILDSTDFATDMAADYNYAERRRERPGGGPSWEGNPSPSPYFSGAGGGSGAGGMKRDIIDLTANGDEGWRSVRKRPVAGQSFGREITARVANVEAAHDETLGWKSERRSNGGGGGGGGGGGEAPAAAGGSQNAVPTESLKQEVLQKPAAKAKPRPSAQQMQVLEAVRNGKSVFLTGSAGTGKSFVIEYAVRLLKIIHRGEGVYVTASTGLAACAVGGTTLHSFAGLGLGNGKKEALVERAKGRREVRNRWLLAKALVIDEISMIDGELFDKLDYVGRKLRNTSQPFGGIQLLVTGDFYQLPPVNPENPEKYFAFEADCWDECFDLQVELETVFRQSDGEFVGVLNEIRRGHCSPSVQMRLQNCSGPVGDNSGVVLTRLYPRKMEVGRENDQNLQALGQPTVVYRARDEARSEFAKKQLENMRVEALISLSLGAQVMLAKNLETNAGLVNGARGVVVGFTSPDDPQSIEINKTAGGVNPSGLWPIVRFASDNLARVIGPESWTIAEGEVEVARRTQVPLTLAWALSVHKCQGMTLDRVETDLSRAFDYGMVYVALSRVKSLDGLRLTGFDSSRIKVHPKVTKFYEKLQQAKDDAKAMVHLS